jgi:hypothetical protein
VTDQGINEFGHLLRKLRRLRCELFEALRQPVGFGRDVLSVEGAEELYLMVSRDAECRPFGHHPHNETKYGRSGGTSIHQVTEEQRPAPLRRLDAHAVGSNLIAKLGQQINQLNGDNRGYRR